MTRKFRVGEIVKTNKLVRKRFADSALICRNIGKMGMIKRKYQLPYDQRFLYKVDFNKYKHYHFIFLRLEISHVSKIRKDEFIAEKVARQL